jgi:hypothetical protein
MDVSQLGRIMVIFGVALVGIGLLMIAGGRFAFFGHLPGDIVLDRDGVTVFVPIASMLVVSVVLTIIVNLVIWLFNR